MLCNAVNMVLSAILCISLLFFWAIFSGKGACEFFEGRGLKEGYDLEVCCSVYPGQSGFIIFI